MEFSSCYVYFYETHKQNFAINLSNSPLKLGILEFIVSINLESSTVMWHMLENCYWFSKVSLYIQKSVSLHLYLRPWIEMLDIYWISRIKCGSKNKNCFKKCIFLFLWVKTASYVNKTARFLFTSQLTKLFTLSPFRNLFSRLVKSLVMSCKKVDSAIITLWHGIIH